MIQQPATRDHSLPNDYLQFMPDMPPERQEEIPKNVITRASACRRSSSTCPPSWWRNDYLLCLIGLTGMVDDG
ncbi:MAG: hypothetical protein R3A78_00915 [Polyangiales bacterium]